MNGIILINKQKGVTSRDIVNDLVHIFHTKKIGHTGTLDPIASGVLVATIGKYTKLNDVIMSTYKEYIAEMKLGIETDTLDITGEVLKKNEVNLSNEEIIKGVYYFEGKYNQEVPIYSAVKVNGKKLYEYARNNETVELPVKEVDIKSIDILDINDNVVKFKCLVSKGTYIRSLIRDIGVYLGCGATMTELTRTKQGKFPIEETYTIDEVRNNNYKLLDLEDVLDLEVIECSDALYKMIKNGAKVENRYTKDFVLFRYNNNDIALYKKDEEIFRMFLSLEEN